MEFKQFLAVLRRRWISVAVILVIALGAASAFTFTRTPQYESTSEVFLSVDVRDTTDAYAALLFASNRAASYARLAESTELSQRVVDTLALDMTAEELSEEISAEVVESTSQITITVTDPDPRQAQEIAQTTTNLFTEYVAELETPSGADSDSQIIARIVADASYNPSSVSPRVALNLVVAGLIGLLLGIALAVTRDILDRTIRTADHIGEITEAPVLASIGYDNQIRQSPLLTDLGAFSPRTEAFRLLRTNLQFIDLDNASSHCVMVSSAVPGEGKTMTATNLAVAIAQTGRRTLLVDADLRRPRVAATLGLDPAVGLTTALVGKTPIQDAIQVHDASGLHVLASGAKPPNPTEILGSKVTADLLARLRASYDFVIIDAPPLLPVADASVLARLADGTILVVRHASTTRDQVGEALARLDQVGGKTFGIVVNMVAKRAISSYYYYYYEDGPLPGAGEDGSGRRGGGKRKS